MHGRHDDGCGRIRASALGVLLTFVAAEPADGVAHGANVTASGWQGLRCRSDRCDSATYACRRLRRAGKQQLPAYYARNLIRDIVKFL